MGCSASALKTIELRRPSSNFTSTLTQERPSSQSSSLISKDKAKASKPSHSAFSPQQHVSSFNRLNFRSGKGIQLNTLSSVLLSLTLKSPSPQIISKKEHYFTALNEVNILKANTANSIDSSENYLNLLSKFKANSYPINSALSFKFTIPQVFFNEYSFEIKLLNIQTNSYDTYPFNQLDRPIIFLFFDILSHEAIEKVKQISDYHRATTDNPSAAFLFLPIMNVFIKEGDDISNEKQLLSLYDITSACYILTNPLNAAFIQLFQLDTITANKAIIVNSNSEICYINNEKAGYLSLEEIDFYLHMRRSIIQKEHFTLQSRDQLIEIITRRFKDLQGRFTSDYHFDVLFTEVNDLKYPITIRVKHSSKDKRAIEELIAKVKEDMAKLPDIRKVFYSFIEVKNLKTEMLEAFEYLNKMLSDNGIKTSAKNYQLMIETSNNQLKNVKKSYLLMFSIMKENENKFQRILELFSANLYLNPQIAKMKIGYAIIPMEGIELAMTVKRCKVIKLFKDKQSQMAFESSNKEVMMTIKTEAIVILNPSYVFKDKVEAQKVRELLEVLKQLAVVPTIVVFSYSEMDSQKLRWLNREELFDDSSDPDLKGIDKIYLNSSEIDNYSYFKYYSEDISIKLLIVTPQGILAHFIDIDLVNIDTITQIKNNGNNNKAECFIQLQSHSTQLGRYDFKKAKTALKKLLSQSMTHNPLLSLNCSQFASVIHNLFYKKLLTFPQKTSFSSFDSAYLGIHLGVIYSDCLEKYISAEDISRMAQKEGITCSLTKLTTKEVQLPAKRMCTICQDLITSNALYLCIECPERIFMCEKCYSEVKLVNHQQHDDDLFFSDLVMNPEDLRKSQSRKWSHCHPLVYCYFYTNSTACRYFPQLYSKYNDKRGIGMKKCNFCDEGYIDTESPTWNIIISHINHSSVSDKNEDAELVICDDCLNSRVFIPKCKEDIEITQTNLLIVKLINSNNK